MADMGLRFELDLVRK